MTELYSKNCITLDGRMDEPEWAKAKEYTGFRMLKKAGGQLAEKQASFRILPCEDRIYIGVMCFEPERAHVLVKHEKASFAIDNSVEIFLSPTGTAFNFYQFAVTMDGRWSNIYYDEGGNIKPDPYAPDWARAVYVGEDYWSAEIELPLTAFYMTPNTRWSDKWLVNVTRSGFSSRGALVNTTWAPLSGSFLEPGGFLPVEGFPMRVLEDDVCISAAMAEIQEESEDGYRGVMTVKTTNAVAADFTFTADCSDPAQVSLTEGANTFTVPCCFKKLGRNWIALQLTRVSDGVQFKRRYPVLVEYEPIKLKMTLPEYRNDFYPGQDYSKIVGTAISAKPMTLKLEGPGIETQVITPDADGGFVFQTPGFEVGEAWLTATVDGYEIKKKIRRLAPSNHQMSWISGGRLMINGEPVLRRSIWARYYRGGEAFRRKYDADDLHETRQVISGPEKFQPRQLLKGCEIPGGEAHRDERPSDVVFETLAKRIEECRDQEFTFYYLSDEPECRGVSPVYLKYLYEYIIDKDPYHVVLIATLRADEFINAADWFETHPYIGPYHDDIGTRRYGRQINSLGRFVDCLAKQERPDKCIGFIPTCYCPSNGDYPTFDEYICHTWAACIRGAKTLAPYAYHDLNDRARMYEGSRYLFASFEALEDFILYAERTTLVRNSEVDAVRYDYNGKQMFILVNLTNQPQQVTLDSITGTWYEFRHDRTITDNAFALKPFEVIIATSQVQDAGLPTYQETAALIDKLEYERTHRGNLLFERHKEIAVTHSPVTQWSGRKLFDGVMDDFVGFLTDGEDKFIELDLSKVKPTFRKVVIGGWHISDMEIKVRKGEELSVPEIAEKTTEEFLTTYILKEAVSPEALRFEFRENDVELYEIEIL